MIREMKEADLQGASTEEIEEMVRERVGPSYALLPYTKADMAAAITVIDGIRKMEPGARSIIARYLQSGELFCRECGKTSCLHGYPDD